MCDWHTLGEISISGQLRSSSERVKWVRDLFANPDTLTAVTLTESADICYLPGIYNPNLIYCLVWLSRELSIVHMYQHHIFLRLTVIVKRGICIPYELELKDVKRRFVRATDLILLSKLASQTCLLCLIKQIAFCHWIGFRLAYDSLHTI